MFLTLALMSCGKLGLSVDTGDSGVDHSSGSADGGAAGGGPGGGPGGGGPGDGGSDGGDGGGTEDSGEVAPEVTAGLEGRTWAVDISTVTFVEPAGLGSLLDLVDTTVLLFHVVAERADSFDMVVTVADAAGQQDPCERVLSLPSADWSGNPAFQIDESELDLTINNEAVSIMDTLLTGVVRADASGWDDGVLQGQIDARQLEPAIGEDLGQDICELVELMGGACGPCDDGSLTCFDLHLVDVAAEPHSGSFDPYVDHEAC